MPNTIYRQVSDSKVCSTHSTEDGPATKSSVAGPRNPDTKSGVAGPRNPDTKSSVAGPQNPDAKEEKPHTIRFHAHGQSTETASRVEAAGGGVQEVTA